MATRIGYAAPLQQFEAREAIALCELAEGAGFDGVMAPDHFQPWLPGQQSPFVWNVLSALGERIKGDFGPGVTTPTFRWHPAMVAQASATLAAMYPGRHWLGLGSGEALNEHVAGMYWPEAPERINRLFEAVEIIKKLYQASLAGRDAKHSGQFYKLETARLWTMPEQAPPILVAASGPVTARRAGRHADGLITQQAAPDRLEHLLSRFSDGARDAGRDPNTLIRVLRLELSWADTDEEAEANAISEWPMGAMAFSKADIRSPQDCAQMARMVRAEHFEGQLKISADPLVHRDHIQGFIDMGFNRIYLHNVGRNQREWIACFAKEIFPGLTL